MSKNIKTISQAILSKFIDQTGAPTTGRITAPENLEQELSLLKDLVEGETWKTHFDIAVVDFVLDENYCIAIKAKFSEESIYQIEDSSKNTIIKIEPVGSIWLYLAHKLGIRAQIKGLEVDELIKFPANSEYGVPLESIKENMETFYVFGFSKDSRLKSSNKYSSIYLMTYSDEILPTKISTNTIELIRELFIDQKDRLFDENLFLALKTPFLHHAFLEVYRTLEFVFVLPRAKLLLDRLNTGENTVKMSILDFARHCNKDLGWRRIERDSIHKLFTDFCGKNYESLIEVYNNVSHLSGSALPDPADDKEQRARFINSLTEKFYSLRNQTAHQFWSDDILTYTEDDWQAIILFTVRCIKYHYDEYLTIQKIPII